MNKPKPKRARSLGELSQTLLTEAFAKQGFASAELVTRWPDIVGPQVAAHAEPLKIQWPRGAEEKSGELATLVLRVEGPAAVEIQHMSAAILDSVNRYFGWQAVGRLALRQAPLSRRRKPSRPTPDPEVVARIAANLPEIEDEELRGALGRLGAMVKRA